MDQELWTALLVGTAAYMQAGRCVCTHPMAAIFCAEWCHGWKCDVKSKNANPPIDAYLLWEQSLLNLLWSDLKWWRLRLFEECHFKNNNKKNNNNKMSSDMGSVPDLKTELVVLVVVVINKTCVQKQQIR